MGQQPETNIRDSLRLLNVNVDDNDDELYVKSRARLDSVTLDIVEPIPEEMAFNLSLADEDEVLMNADGGVVEEDDVVTKVITEYEGDNMNVPLTPAVDFDTLTKAR